MQKLNLTQSLQQKLSPQQIQFIKLLQIPTMELQTRVQEELAENPALEEGREEEDYSAENAEDDYGQEEELYDTAEEINFDEYISNDDVSGYKMQGDGADPDEDDREMPLSTKASLLDDLLDQLSYLNLNERQNTIGRQLIGSIDTDGYIKRDLEAIVNDLAFTQGVETTFEEVEGLLKKIQFFEPPGIAARNLQECLELQIKRKDTEHPDVKNALKVVMLCFDEFKKKHYPKIQRKLNVDEEALRRAFDIISKLNPKPGGMSDGVAGAQYLTPDFILKEVDGRIEVTLNARNAPELKISRSYSEMIDSYDKAKKRSKKMRETASFLKQKLDSAKWFIDAIKQRQETLLKTMRAIVHYQYDFFLTGDESKLRPMILKNIAEEIGMDISTVSRVANSKAVQTDFGIFLLKYFFSESIATDSGEDVSSKEVKYYLRQMIEEEDKRKPYSDEKLEKLLKLKGYQIARRTVAKYREQMDIPVARLRKEL